MHPTHSAPSALAGSSHSVREVSVPADLVCIFDPEVQVVRLPRPADPALQHHLDTLAQTGGLGRGFRLEVPADATRLEAFLPPTPASEALAADLAHLHQLFVDLIGCHATGLRYEVTDHAICPRFHVDRVGIRLLCTYRGPATEWIDEAWADRSKLGGDPNRPPDAVSGLLRDPARVRRASPFDLLLLKGSAWPGNETMGGIHRSPAVEPHEAPRVMVSLDALWPMG